ncbi:tRNA dihydrouridine(20/20a) synthase DusA [Aliikangiella coralliicola]|uniref:tRNA-dihydrouridine(20/20a) synthase n=1 Tax=Aliikangiella coralliicola TaxID=2592383 RepID=A0A545TW60_9GAMM|nr:tRNA dihydrouridine(20/20a) synthase DusA [Aliikangiella coralliicola]TQV81456.1 tRNA dihydrouridine(20/20a) synthase DusA [Aliikangiella coralliicola]
MLDRRISIAPMMDWTDRHDRYFLRQITKKAVLYTEMVTTGAILFGEAQRYLQFRSDEHPVAVQLGGGNPKELARSAVICEDYGYDEINLNVGCPSDRVQSGKIGACLMAEPELVAECIGVMSAAVNIPVTIKHRTGIDDEDSYESLANFVKTVAEVGCQTFIIHARQAILSGLSPKQNREIPPLCYPKVYQIKQEFPNLEVIINGGVKTLQEAEAHLQHVDGVMIGREAYHNPFILAEVDSKFYGESSEPFSRLQVARALLPYIEQELATGTRLQHIARHILGLFHGQPRGKLWRRYLSENAHKENAGCEVIEQALKLVEGAAI